MRKAEDAELGGGHVTREGNFMMTNNKHQLFSSLRSILSFFIFLFLSFFRAAAGVLLDFFTLVQNLGVFLVSAKNAFVPLKRDNSVNTHSRISTVPRGSERSE